MSIITPLSFVVLMLMYHRLGKSSIVVVFAIFIGLLLDVYRLTSFGLHGALLLGSLLIYQYLAAESRIRSIVYASTGMGYCLIAGVVRFGVEPALLSYLGWSAVWLSIGWIVIRSRSRSR